VLSQTAIFATELKSYNKFKIIDSWFNVCEKGDFHGTHNHARSMFSAVYYVSMPEGSASIIFESYNDNMLPLKITKDNPLNSRIATYYPNGGDLLIFRSDLRHSVGKNNSVDPRISISYNLDYT
jgi:hypothetical protein